MARGLGGAGLVAVVVMCGRESWFRVSRDDAPQRAAWQGARWIRTHTAPEAVLAMRKAEVLSFFTDRQVVDLTGLVSNLELQHAIADKRLAKYLAESRVQYLVSQGVRENPDLLVDIFGGQADLCAGRYEKATLRYRSHLWGAFSDPLSLLRSDEVYRVQYKDDGEAVQLVVWRTNFDTSN